MDRREGALFIEWVVYSRSWGREKYRAWRYSWSSSSSRRSRWSWEDETEEG